MQTSTQNNSEYNSEVRGFIAVTAVIMIACSTLLFASIVMKASADYSDTVTRHEWRIQANLNAESCLQHVALMSAKDYFLSGEIFVSVFGCKATVVRDRVYRKVFIKAQSVFNTVKSAEFSQSVNI